MHAACSNGNGSRHAPETPTPGDRLGTAFAEPAAPPENAAGGRDARGRFAPGNAGGPGNPFARRTAELRREFLAEATGADLRAVCRALLERAKEGDVAAAKLALSYLVGKPDKAVDPDTLDEQEWHIWRRYTAPSEWVELIQTLPLDVILSLIRSVWPVLAAEKCAQAQPLFATPGPVPPEPDGEAAGEKPRARRRRGKGRRPQAEESSPGTECPKAELPAEESRPVEAGSLGCSRTSGASAAAGEYEERAREASAPVCVPAPAQSTTAVAGLGGEQQDQVREGPADTATCKGGTSEQSPQRAEGQVRPVAPGAVSCSGTDACAGARPPSTIGDIGAAPGAGTPVYKRGNRLDPAGQPAAGHDVGPSRGNPV